jgi:hypothetical protein
MVRIGNRRKLNVSKVSRRGRIQRKHLDPYSMVFGITLTGTELLYCSAIGWKIRGNDTS